MPIYEYQCTHCGKRHEVLQKISDPLLTDCVDCGQAALKKLISRTSFQLKGGGWYATDFKDAKPKNAVSETDKTPVKTESAGDKTASATKTDVSTSTADKNQAASANTSASSKTE